MITYTFHVSLPDHGRVWRKLELPAESTLEDLHLAIQNAYEFDNDHLYSFFMSGRAWDADSEYSMPEGVSPWGEVWDDEEDDEEVLSNTPDAPQARDITSANLPSQDLLSPQNLRLMIAALQGDPKQRDEFKVTLMQRSGMPAILVDTLLNQIGNMIRDLSNAEIESILSGGGNIGDLFDKAKEARDVRTATLESLALKKGKKFLYLFDYGDEWRFTIKVDSINKTADASLTYPRLVESVGDAPLQYPDWDADEEEGWDEDNEVGEDDSSTKA
jgi:hypothetical protein